MSSAADTTRTPPIIPREPRRKRFKLPPLGTVVWDWGMTLDGRPDPALWLVGMLLGSMLAALLSLLALTTLEVRRLPPDSTLERMQASADRRVLIRAASCAPCVTPVTADDMCLSWINP